MVNKTQSFETLGIKIPILMGVSFQDEGPQEDLLSWAESLHKQRFYDYSFLRLAEIRGQRLNGKWMVGQCIPLEDFRGTKEIQHTSYHIGYDLFRDERKQLTVRTHEEGHAADHMLNLTKLPPLLYALDSEGLIFLPSYLKKSEDFRRGDERVAHLGTILGLMKVGMSKREAFDYYANFFGGEEKDDGWHKEIRDLERSLI